MFKRFLLILSIGCLLGVSVSMAAPPHHRYGILGRQAPELTSVEWIGQKGDNIDPIRLSDLKGNVIYLLFFQDW